MSEFRGGKPGSGTSDPSPTVDVYVPEWGRSVKIELGQQSIADMVEEALKMKDDRTVAELAALRDEMAARHLKIPPYIHAWTMDAPPDGVDPMVATVEYLAAIERGECPNHKRPIAMMQQVGDCVYGSCGCRLYQGTLP